MGPSEAKTPPADEIAEVVDKASQRRFAMHFPKVFAYAHSWTLDEERSREIVMEAFARTFSRGRYPTDEDFAIVLFSVTRDLCSGVRTSSSQAEAGLSDPEREVLALLFDAQLSRQQVGSLLKMPEDSVAATLVRGLRKLKNSVRGGSKPSLQQL